MSTERRPRDRFLSQRRSGAGAQQAICLSDEDQRRLNIYKDHVGNLLHRVGQLADEIFARECSDVSLKPRQGAVLSCLGENQVMSQANIVVLTGIDRSTVADIIKRLVAKSWVLRQRSKSDSCRDELRLTASGRTARTEAKRAVSVTNQILLECLSFKRRRRACDDCRGKATETRKVIQSGSRYPTAQPYQDVTRRQG